MTHHQRARKFFKQGQHEKSVDLFSRHIASHPHDAQAHLDMAAPLFALGEMERAEQAAKSATELNASNPEAWSTLATIQAARGQIGTPLKSILQATKIEPQNIKYRLRLASLLLDQGHLDHAVKTYDIVLKQVPSNIEAIAGKASVLERQGHMREAHDLMEPIISSAPPNPNLGATWGTVCRRLKQPEMAIDVLLRMLAEPMNDVATSMLLAELGALYDAVGQIDAAYAAYTEANKRRHGTFDPDGLKAYTDRLISTFSSDLFERAPVAETESERPILIVGMPRSGTSLAEQILSAHPDVFGAGELEDMRAASLLGEQLTSETFPEWVRDAPLSTFNQLGQWYVDRRLTQSTQARWVTDKMPQNFQMLGLAALMIPGVKIIHCVRDPLDTALSCYFQGFKAALAWSNRLEWLGPYLVQYRRLMAHWSRVLPIPIYTLEYEKLVSNPESEIRALLAHCGIPFHENCVNHHKSGRMVATASYAQANKPIYGSSRGRARRYTKHLAPLVEVLESA